MSELFVKEWRLAVPAVDVMFVFLGALVLVPAYPYGMVFFFGMLAAFFSCQFARENADIFYTMLLPVGKRDVVKGKMMLIVSIELAQLALTIPFAIVRTELLPNGNPVGIEANVAYFGRRKRRQGVRFRRRSGDAAHSVYGGCCASTRTRLAGWLVAERSASPAADSGDRRGVLRCQHSADLSHRGAEFLTR